MNRPENSPMRHVLRQGLVGFICSAILLAVLSLYLRPDFLLTLANQVLGCF